MMVDRRRGKSVGSGQLRYRTAVGVGSKRACSARDSANVTCHVPGPVTTFGLHLVSKFVSPARLPNPIRIAFVAHVGSLKWSSTAIFNRSTDSPIA